MMFEPSTDRRVYIATGLNGLRYRIHKRHVEGRWFADEWKPENPTDELGSYTGKYFRDGTWEQCRRWCETQDKKSS